VNFNPARDLEGLSGHGPPQARRRRPQRAVDGQSRADPYRGQHGFDQQKPGTHPNRVGGVALAGAPAAVREYMDEYVATGANYFVCSFQWGDLSHAQAMRIELFATEVMPRYAPASTAPTT
jgi:alkanesulfonate monooxygenase SsuD/methylene tetrahydromethanopterin reductase-like flavin-dependent oxidoreductase (luciferase family)